MTRDQLIESIRLSIAAVNEGCSRNPCCSTSPDCICAKETTAALTAAEAAGMRVVPAQEAVYRIADGLLAPVIRHIEAAQEDSTSD
jgi:hypothetical protein